LNTSEPRSDQPRPRTNWWRIRRLSINGPIRGRRGIVVIAGAAVVVVVIGSGVMAVGAVVGWVDRSDRKDSSLVAVPALNSEPTSEKSISPSPVPTTATVTASPRPSAKIRHVRKPKAVTTPKPKVTATKKAVSAGTVPGTTTSAKLQIKNLATGFCLDLAPGGTAQIDTQFTQSHCAATTSQQFELIRTNGAFLIRDVKSHFCLNVWGTEAVAETELVTAYDCALGAADNQMFRTQAQGDGYYLVNVKSGLCLDVSDAGAGDSVPGAGMTLYPCSPDDDHIWQLG
jgi:hypothetical protein